MKTCPTCSSQSTVLITNVQTGQQFCYQCAGTVCPSFVPGLVYTLEDVKLLRDCGIDPEIGNIEAKIPTQTTQFVLADLIFFRDASIQVDEEMFVSVLHHENMHRDFAPCSDCRVTTFHQHDPACRYASVLWVPEWYEIVEAREAARIRENSGK
jgi:hypothetical protein